jgi:hypothetical protein
LRLNSHPLLLSFRPTLDPHLLHLCILRTSDLLGALLHHHSLRGLLLTGDLGSRGAPLLLHLQALLCCCLLLTTGTLKFDLLPNCLLCRGLLLTRDALAFEPPLLFGGLSRRGLLLPSLTLPLLFNSGAHLWRA